MGLGLTGKPGHAWVVAWMHGWVVWVGDVVGRYNTKPGPVYLNDSVHSKQIGFYSFLCTFLSTNFLILFLPRGQKVKQSH